MAAAEVASALSGLDRQARDAVTQVYFQGATFSQAAVYLGVSPGEVSAAVARAFRLVNELVIRAVVDDQRLPVPAV